MSAVEIHHELCMIYSKNLTNEGISFEVMLPSVCSFIVDGSIQCRRMLKYSRVKECSKMGK
jgi:hypothetical protein